MLKKIVSKIKQNEIDSKTKEAIAKKRMKILKEHTKEVIALFDDLNGIKFNRTRYEKRAGYWDYRERDTLVLDKNNLYDFELKNVKFAKFNDDKIECDIFSKFSIFLGDYFYWGWDYVIRNRLIIEVRVYLMLDGTFEYTFDLDNISRSSISDKYADLLPNEGSDNYSELNNFKDEISNFLAAIIQDTGIIPKKKGKK